MKFEKEGEMNEEEIKGDALYKAIVKKLHLIRNFKSCNACIYEERDGGDTVCSLFLLFGFYQYTTESMRCDAFKEMNKCLSE